MQLFCTWKYVVPRERTVLIHIDRESETGRLDQGLKPGHAGVMAKRTCLLFAKGHNNIK